MAKKSSVSSYNKQLQAIMHRYREETGVADLNWDAVILWAENKGLIARRMVDPHKKLKEDFSRAAREDVIYDVNGDPVRRMHAYIPTGNGEPQLMQKTLWGHIEDLTPHRAVPV